MRIEPPPCNECGLCCVTDLAFGRGGFVQVTKDDQARMPEKYRLTVVKDSDPGKDRLGTKAPFRGWQRCVALKGILERRTRCDIYEDRPAVCRSFERGSNDCHKERARYRHSEVAAVTGGWS